jgi:hypothetical protein
MHGFGICNDPGFCIVTFCTIRAQRSLMDISVASSTFIFCFLKLKCRVTTFAVNNLMLPGKLKPRRFMVERHLLQIHLPVFGAVTGSTVNFETIAMWRLSKTVQREHDQYYFK